MQELASTVDPQRDERPLVLIADDNEVDRMVLRAIVGREGYPVVDAHDGVDALEKFCRLRPGMVLLDAVMPGMDGFEVARRIKELAGEDFVPVIFMTALRAADELARCLDAGGDDFVTKPYNKVILRAKLAALERMQQMHSTLQRQRDHIAQLNAYLVHEQEAAKAVFDNVTHSGALADGNIKHLISPLAIFNGDVLLAARNPGGGLYVLLGDFTGHGLTAAIGAMPLAEIFYGMARKGFLLQDIVRECNAKMKKMLPPGYFCCAAMVDFNFQKHTAEAWIGGIPLVLVYRATDGSVSKLASNHLPLGIVDGGGFDGSTHVVDLAVGDRFVMCTDGLLEARNASGEMFGEQRLMEIIGADAANAIYGGAARLFERIVHGISTHIGGREVDDDTTLVEVTMVEESEMAVAEMEFEDSGQVIAQDWRFQYELGPKSLKSFNPLPLLQHILMEIPQLRVEGSAIYTVLAELFSNALEHGVLGLSSAVKSTASGFASYYARRAEALDNLIDGWVRFEFESHGDQSCGQLVVRVVDSGPGFDFEARGNESGEYHGRGLALLSKLCSELRFKGAGNEVEAVFSWGS